MTVLGNLVLWLAFLVGVWGALAGLVGGLRARPDLQQSARHAVFVMCGALLVAVFSLEVALFRHDFNVEYVAAYTSRNLPIFYTWSALYAGQKGSLLFWAAVLSVFGSLALVLTPRRQRELLPYVAAVVSLVAAFFISVMLFGGANPFRRLPYTPVDGSGLNPQLQNPGMVFHPPMLYLGYISITIPFAFAMAALLSKRLDTDWLVAIRKWTLLSWLFLSIGICLGMWWAYVELGWGGYWAWDPVENASLLPWLTMTAFLHSVMIQEKRGMLKKWNLALIIGSWLLSIFGTFITRSGVISSVHSFTQSNVGYFFLFFLLVAGTASFTLYATRLPLLSAEARLESMVSREASFLFNNLVLITIAFAVLWGTLLPILSEAVVGVKYTVLAPWFNTVNVPLGLALLALTGIGPLIAWRRASIPNLRRQFAVPVTAGVFTVLVLLLAGMRDGYALVAIGLGGFVAGTIAQEFARGVSARHRQYGEPYLLALGRLIARNRLVTAAAVEVRRDGKRIGMLNPEKRQHVDSFGRPTFQPSTEPSIMSLLREDLYGVLGGVVNGTEQAVFRFTINPLVWWVWYGGMIVALGGLVVMWPGGGGSPAAKRSQAGYSVRLVGEK